MKIRNVALAVATILLVTPLNMSANAASGDGAYYIHSLARNFTPIEKAACGPFWGRWCGPWHHRVCNPWRCWCARC